MNSLQLLVAPPILRTRAATFPQFEFEWHVTQQKVYVVEGPRGTCIAEHCEDHGRFIGLVQTWLRGFRRGQQGDSNG